MTTAVQRPQQIDPCHTRHLLVHYQTCHFAHFRVIEKLLAGRIGLDRMARRFQQSIKHVAHVAIVIDYCNYVQIFCGHLGLIPENRFSHPDETK